MRIKVSLGEINGIERLINEHIRMIVQPKIDKLLLKLADIGVSEARSGFANAIYDGVNDVTVLEPYWDKNKLVIKAVGEAVAFIEFGTGITYTEEHPMAQSLNMTRGSYGKGRGKQRSWGYYGEAGTNGIVRADTPKGKLVITKGNPANRVLYNSAKLMRDKILDIAREVLK